MPLPSFFQRKIRPAERRSPTPAGDDAAVQAARTRARQRLIGAVVLLAIGIVGFPLVFDTRPRPIPVDLPIEVARSAGPAPVASAAPTTSQTPPNVAVEDRSPTPPRTEPVAAAVVEPKAQRPTPAPESPKPAATLAPAPTPAEPKRPAPAPVTGHTEAADAARAKALLAGASAAAPVSGRFVVQVGAYGDPAALHEVRQRVEKLGLKTYTQAVETAAGKRTRVRVGPFASRAEAESVGARLKSAGLPAAVLAL